MTDPSRRSTDPSEEGNRLIAGRPYRKALAIGALAVSALAILPLVIMSGVSYRLYTRSFREELTRPMLGFVSAGSRSLDAFLSERRAALSIVGREHSLAELSEPGALDTLLSSLQRSFADIVDLGAVDGRGIQVAYAGPHELRDADYSRTRWLTQVREHGVHVSEVVTGPGGRPHLVVAAEHDRPGGPSFVLRTSVEPDAFHFLVRDRPTDRSGQGEECRRCHALGVESFGDAFLINDAGRLQTPSASYGDVLARAPLPPLPALDGPALIEVEDESGSPLVVGYGRVPRSPFTLVLVTPQVALHAGWRSLRRDLVLIPAISSLVLLVAVLWGASYAVRRVRHWDRKRAALFHEIEYTNKMAAIGRLGAGVAHEINNPLSIITEKAGLLKDILSPANEPPSRAKMNEVVDSLLGAADRCAGITRSLLGFAKHMHVGREEIRLDGLLDEVVGFLQSAAVHRNVHFDLDGSSDPVTVVSDRGQLQQVFLNLFNNALAAVPEGGRISVSIHPADDDHVAVRVADDGVGIPPGDLGRIFDPFFTTKKGSGTGLGLSITYGIVQKLGGRISVESDVGVGTCFTVTLPTQQRTKDSGPST